MAATSVLKLIVDDKEYGPRLKEAQQGLQAVEEAMKQAGASMNNVHNDVLNYVRGLGQMETSSKTATGKLAEMKKAFIELSVQYNNLTDEEKNSPFGKALSQSLDQLKQRFNDSKRQLEEVSRSLDNTGESGKNTGGIMDMLKDKFTVNIDALKLFEMGLKTTNAALGVAKDAFFASEASVDEWGRTVQAAQSVYDGFLNALNTGDISGFLSRIDEIISAARDAYNELDRLGTMKTIQRPQISKQQTENDRLRQMIMTRRYIPKAEGFDWFGAGMTSGQLLNDNQVRMLETMLQVGINKVVDLTKNEVQQSGRAIDSFYNQFSKEIGMSAREFRRGTSSMAEFDERVRGAREYNLWERRRNYAISAAASGLNMTDEERSYLNGSNPYAQYKGWDVFRVDGDKYKQLVDLIVQRDQQIGQVYSMQSQAYRTINRAEGITSRIGGGGGGSGRTGSTPAVKEVREMTGLIELQQQKVKDLQAQIAHAPTESMITYLQGDLKVAQDELDRLQGKVKEVNGEGLQLVTTETLGPLDILEDQLKTIQESMQHAETTEDYAEMLAAAADVQEQIKAFKGENKKEPKTVNLSQELGNIVSGISGMTSSIEQLGIELPEGMKDVLGGIQSMISILTSIGTIVSAIEAISAADFIKPFARGGVVHAAGGYKVPGNHYSGDNIPALLDAGEVVLNRAQAASLASDLQSGAGAGGYRPSYISGEQIYLALNRYTKRTGKGELVTWRD